MSCFVLILLINSNFNSNLINSSLKLQIVNYDFVVICYTCNNSTSVNSLVLVVVLLV